MKRYSARRLQRDLYGIIEDIPIIIDKQINLGGKYHKVKTWMLVPYTEELEIRYDKLASYKETADNHGAPSEPVEEPPVTEPAPEPTEFLVGADKLPEDVPPADQKRGFFGIFKR